MRVKHLKAYPIFYGWMGDHGKELILNQEWDISDKMAFNTGLRNAVANNQLEILFYDTTNI